MEHKYEGYVHEIKVWDIGKEPRTWYELFEMRTGNRNEYHSQEKLVERLVSELDRAENVEVFHAIDTFKRAGTVKPITNEIRSRSPSLVIRKNSTVLMGESRLLASLQEMAVEALNTRAQEAPAQSA